MPLRCEGDKRCNSGVDWQLDCLLTCVWLFYRALKMGLYVLSHWSDSAFAQKPFFFCKGGKGH